MPRQRAEGQPLAAGINTAPQQSAQRRRARRSERQALVLHRDCEDDLHWRDERSPWHLARVHLPEQRAKGPQIALLAHRAARKQLCTNGQVRQLVTTGRFVGSDAPGAMYAGVPACTCLVLRYVADLNFAMPKSQTLARHERSSNTFWLFRSLSAHHV